MIGGLCYRKCREGYSHPSGIGVTCTRSYTKKTFVIPPQSALCPPGKTNIGGLCYSSDVPPGYTRKVVGTLDQSCPAGSRDIGVACQRETYNRGAGKVPLHVYIKPRKAQQVDTPAPTCQEAKMLFSNPDEPQLCRETTCADDELLQGDFCVAKCKPGYTDEGLTCKSATDSYTKRDPRPVLWSVF